MCVCTCLKRKCSVYFLKRDLYIGATALSIFSGRTYMPFISRKSKKTANVNPVYCLREIYGLSCFGSGEKTGQSIRERGN